MGGPSPRLVPPGPDNPLGDYAMRLNVSRLPDPWHEQPVGIGMQVTHGCIRMYPEDIEWLYQRVTVGTPVLIVNQPIKFGWDGAALYLQVHRPLEEGGDNGDNMTAVTTEFVRATVNRRVEADWSLIGETYRRRDGIPVRVGTLAVSEPVPAKKPAPGAAGAAWTRKYR